MPGVPQKRKRSLNASYLLGGFLVLCFIVLSSKDCGNNRVNFSPPNGDFPASLFLGTGRHTPFLETGITNITFVRAKRDAMFIGPPTFYEDASKILIETNSLEIAKIVTCFQTRPSIEASGLIKEDERWHILIFNSKHGWGHVSLARTDVTGMFSAKLNYHGTSVTIQNCYSLE